MDIGDISASLYNARYKTFALFETGYDTLPCAVWDGKRKGKGEADRAAAGEKRGHPRHYPAYKKGQLNVSELARVCDISRTTVYKYIGLLEA